MKMGTTEETELLIDSTLRCKVCGSDQVHKLYEDIADPLEHVQDHFSIYECAQCNILFTFPVICNSDLGFLYGGQYFSAGEELNWAEKLYRYDQYRYDLGLFSNLINHESKIFDYGCGNGSRVKYLWSKGYVNTGGVDKYNQGKEGVELDGRIVKCDPLQYLPNEKYDVVTVYHVLEHLPDFMYHLDHIRRNLLAKDGLLVVQVPNADCWQLKYAGSSWVVLDVPRHFWHFNRRSLNKALQQNDYDILRIVARNSVLHPTSILSTVFGYDVREQWRLGKKSALRLQAEFLLLHLLAFPLAVVESLFQSSSMLNVIAKNGSGSIGAVD